MIYGKVNGETYRSEEPGNALELERTGEIRPPKAGEWFLADETIIIRATFTFKALNFPILKPIVTSGEKGDHHE